MRPRLFALFALFSVAVAAAASAPDLPAPLRDYRGWTLVTPAPVPVPLALWVLCRKPEPAEITAAERQHGEHAHHSIRVFVNAAAAAHFADPRVPLPAGSMVVKEKLDGTRPDAVDAVAAMIKRPAGFSPESGDWEFLYFDGKKERSSGDRAALQAHCGECHAGSRSTDWLFRTYLPAADQNGAPRER